MATTEPSHTRDNQEEYLCVINNKSTTPYKVQLEVKGKPLTMEVDTGAAVSLAPESAVESLLSASELQPSNVILKTYTGEQSPVKCSLLVDVKYGQQRYTNLKLVVNSGFDPCLMGRDWLRIVRLDWRPHPLLLLTFTADLLLFKTSTRRSSVIPSVQSLHIELS